MADKLRRLKDRASRYYADGKLRDALGLYERIVSQDPTELGCLIKVGDIHRRLGEAPEAIKAYEGVARKYAEDGLLLKAIAVCKLILSVDARHTQTQNMLADLYARRRGGAAQVPPLPVVESPGLELDTAEDPALGPAWPASSMEAVSIQVGGGQNYQPGVTEADTSAWPSSVRTLELDDEQWPGAEENEAPEAAVALAWPGASTASADGAAWPVNGQSQNQTIEDSVLDITVDEAALTAATPIIVGEKVEESTLDIVISEGEVIDEPTIMPMGDDEPISLSDEQAVDVPIELTEVVEEDEEVIEIPPVAAAATHLPPTEETWSGKINLDDVQDPPSASELPTIIPEADEPAGEHALIPLFSDLPKRAFIELLVQMRMHEMRRGEYVINEGEVGDSFFVVASGVVSVRRRGAAGQEILLAHLTDGAFFGEMALLQGGARTASVRVEEDSQIFEISKDVLDRVISAYPSVATAVRNFYRQRLLATAMATHALFRPFDQEERRKLMELFKSKSFDAGAVLLEEGKKGNGLYILLNGQLEVTKSMGDGEAPVLLAELKAGDLFGEMSLLTGKPINASITAASDCFVLRLSRKKFDELIMTHPQVLELVAQVSEQRESLNQAILGGQLSASGAVMV